MGLSFEAIPRQFHSTSLHVRRRRHSSGSLSFFSVQLVSIRFIAVHVCPFPATSACTVVVSSFFLVARRINPPNKAVLFTQRQQQFSMFLFPRWFLRSFFEIRVTTRWPTNLPFLFPQLIICKINLRNFF